MDSLTIGPAGTNVSRIGQKNQYLSKTELLEALKPFVVPRSSASRMLMKIETNGHALHTGKSAAGRKRVKMSEPNRSALLSSTSNKIGVSVHFLAKKQDKNKSCVHQSLKEGLNEVCHRTEIAKSLCWPKNPSPRGRIRALARGPLCANRSVGILTDGYLFHLF